jgi:MFS superfamily sulfate permease-like transporter
MPQSKQSGKDLKGFRATIGSDALASVVVFLVALPLCMGVSIASGVPPTAGLITGIVGGLIVGFLAGSPLQVSGPAAGLTVLVWQLVQHHGLAMLGIIVLIAGLIQVLAGILKLGQWFRAVSPAVIHGMLAGIGVLIFASQFHVMLDNKPIGSGIENLIGIPAAVINSISENGSSMQALYIGILTIVMIAVWVNFAPKKLKVLPPPLIAVLFSVGIAAFFQLKIKYIPDLLANPDDINNIWTVIQYPTLENLKRAFEPAIFTAAVSVAFIASAETLLSASAVDKLHQGERTKYDRELTAQGVGNTICGVMGVLPMTGVIVRSTANVEAGGKTRAATIMHGGWLLLFATVLPFTLSYIPVASLAAVLVCTGYKLAYPKVIPELLKYGKSEVAIYIVTIVMIVATNLLEGVLIGLGLSMLKLLQAFTHLEINWDEDIVINRVHLYLKGAATLIRLPKLAATLDEVRPGAEVHIHFEHLNYIDHACLDLLSSWEIQHELTGGKLIIEWEELSARYHMKRTGAQQEDTRIIR